VAGEARKIQAMNRYVTPCTAPPDGYYWVAEPDISVKGITLHEPRIAHLVDNGKELYWDGHEISDAWHDLRPETVLIGPIPEPAFEEFHPRVKK
jgi:hypothetical protein